MAAIMGDGIFITEIFSFPSTNEDLFVLKLNTTLNMFLNLHPPFNSAESSTHSLVYFARQNVGANEPSFPEHYQPYQLL